MRLNPRAMVFEPKELYDPAIISTTREGAAVYCVERLLGILAEEFAELEDPYIRAVEWLTYNMMGAANNFEPRELRAHFKEEPERWGWKPQGQGWGVQ